MLELNDEQKYETLKRICMREGSRCFLNLIDFDYSQMSKDEMLKILLQEEPNEFKNESKEERYNNIFNNTIEYCCMEERMDPDFFITYCKEFLNPDLQTKADIVKIFNECNNARTDYAKEVKDLREERKSILEGKDVEEIDAFSQKLDTFIKDKNLETFIKDKNLETQTENTQNQKDEIQHKLNQIEIKLDIIANHRPQMKKIFDINANNIQQFENFLENIKNQNFSDSDKIKMNFL